MEEVDERDSRIALDKCVLIGRSAAMSHAEARLTLLGFLLRFDYEV